MKLDKAQLRQLDDFIASRVWEMVRSSSRAVLLEALYQSKSEEGQRLATQMLLGLEHTHRMIESMQSSTDITEAAQQHLRSVV